MSQLPGTSQARLADSRLEPRLQSHRDQRLARHGTPVAVVASRVAHGLIALGLMGCIGLVYLAAWRGHVEPTTQLALVALGVEGALVWRSGWDCPLQPLFRSLGDDRTLFELFMPPPAARLAVPLLGGITAIGIALLGLRTL
jgi:hypothetical protein